MFTINLYISFVLLAASVLGCNKNMAENKETIEVKEGQNNGGRSLTPAEERYIVFFLTNTSVDQADSENIGRDANPAYTFVGELPQIFGAITADAPYKYAFGLSGPMLLTQSVQQMQYQVNKAFDIAEKYNVPVYFQLDDINNYTVEFGSDANPKFYENPSWCEWVAFPGAGETWGGQANGRLPYYWFNWGNWMHAKAFPNLQSPGFRAFVKSQLENGVLPVLNTRYNQLKTKGKAYLFAGMAIGWETHIPDYSADNTLYNVNPAALPVNANLGDQMQPWEAGKLGYAALHTLGYTAYDKERLYQVIHDYSELLAKTVYDSGIPREKIFSHIVGIKSAHPNLSTTFAPPIWTAVNDYSIPGFTLSPVSCPYNLNTLKAEINLADAQQANFANVEGYSIGVNGSFAQADAYFGDMFGHGAAMVAVFGWGREPATSDFAVSHSPASPFVQAAKKWLGKEVKVWSFTTDAAGWTAGNDISGFGWNNGGIGGNITGADAFIQSGDNLNIPLDNCRYVVIRIRNTSPQTIGQVYFTTTTDMVWNDTKQLSFGINPNSDFTTYTIDMSAVPGWTGTLKQLRIDPCNAMPGTPVSGSFQIQYIKMVQ